MGFAVFIVDFGAQYTLSIFIMLFSQPILVLLRAYSILAASPLEKRAAPTVTLDTATVTGVASGSVNEWLGIPFALPP
jgi:hypothetical protein